MTLADLGEIASSEINKKKTPKELNENMEEARRSGKIAGNALEEI